MAPAAQMGKRCIENWPGGLLSAVVSSMLPSGPEIRMKIQVRALKLDACASTWIFFGNF